MVLRQDQAGAARDFIGEVKMGKPAWVSSTEGSF
jgi:hypothetical protein